MQTEILKEHDWLQQFLGDWRCEMTADMGPGQPPAKSEGSESVRAIGGIWIQGEGHGPMPDGGMATMLLTLGYDPQKQRYVGTWLGSMMTYLWVYEGGVEGNVLTLDTVGPDMSGTPGKLIRYQDTHEFKSRDHRVLTSRMWRDDGQWLQFMRADYYRTR
jgi:hypothetical protein